MTTEQLTTAEQLAMRLIAGDEDPLVFQSLRYAALAQANDWQAPWLAREFVEVFDRASARERSHPETAAIVLGMLQATRVSLTEIKKRADERSFRTNPAVYAAVITAVGLVIAAAINQMGNLSSAKPQPSPQMGEGKPNVIQIVVPTQAPPTVVLQADPKPAALASASPKPRPVEVSASPAAVSSPPPSLPSEAPSQPETP